MKHVRVRRRLFVPEVVQTSATDCGPACLTSLLEAHGISASYGRLREACRTDVDGTSIDTLEAIARDLGLDARQVMLPVEHVLAGGARALPALVVVRQPDGVTHFVVAWRAHGGVVQVMDPATGRRWTRARQFLDELYVHEMEVPADAFAAWSHSDEFLGSVASRMRRLGLSRGAVTDAIAACRAGSGWQPGAALDAATRAVEAMAAEGGLRTRRERSRALLGLFASAREARDPAALLPAEFWTALVTADPATVRLRGAVLVSIAGVRKTGVPASELPRDLARALQEPRARPGLLLWSLLRADGLLAPASLVAFIAFAALGLLVEALLLRALFDAGTELAVPEQRLAAMGVLGAFLMLMLALELPIWTRALALGRQLECRARMALCDKLARVPDRYFRSRLVSDMAERSHRLHELRTVPELGVEFLRAAFGILFTTAAIVWLDAHAALPAIVGALLCIALPLLAQPLLSEADLRVRSHAGGILRFHLDALLGIVPLRAHAAGRAMRAQHTRLSRRWADAGLQLQGRVVGIEAVQSLVACAVAIVVLWGHGTRSEADAGSLLLVYWVLSLPVLGQQVGLCARRYPALRSITLRLVELLGTPTAEGVDATAEKADAAPAAPAAPADAPGERATAAGPTAPATARAAAIRFQHVTVQAAGHTILQGVDLDVAAGSHVAIVGPSGAGKSSLVGLLLGWHEPASGRVLVDGEPLRGERLARLRAETAWVDPGVQIWNQSLLDNLLYGNGGRATPQQLGAAMERSGVTALLDGLPDGMQTWLGESGALVSGGEGQRVRLARAALHGRTRLVVLDEPFRGLARDARAELLARARELWRHATLLCVTHDVAATLAFDRVLVVERGRIVEDGSPCALASGDTRFAAHLAAERGTARDGWSRVLWRRLRLERGRLEEAVPETVA